MSEKESGHYKGVKKDADGNEKWPRHMVCDYLKKSTSSVALYIKSGELKKLPDGYFLRSDVEEFAAVKGFGEGADQAGPGNMEKMFGTFLVEMKEAQSTDRDHIKSLVGLMIKQTNEQATASRNVVELLRKENKSLRKGQAKRDKAHLAILDSFGTMLLREKEQEMLEQEAADKKQRLDSAWTMFQQLAPSILEGASANKGAMQFLKARSAEELEDLKKMLEGQEDDSAAGLIKVIDKEIAVRLAARQAAARKKAAHRAATQAAHSAAQAGATAAAGKSGPGAG